MATVAGIKIKSKAPKSRNPLFADEKYTGGEPDWPVDSEKWEKADFDRNLRRSMFYYNYFYSPKDMKKAVTEWMKTSKMWSKEEIRTFDSGGDRILSTTYGAVVMAHQSGMPLIERVKEKLVQEIKTVINSIGYVAEVAEKDSKTQKAVQPSIQDRMNERTSELLGELEGYYDDIANAKAKQPKFYDWLTEKNVVQTQLGKYEALFIKRKEELELAQSKKDDQLKEGYSHYKAADFKSRLKWIEDLLGAVEQYRGVKKATKKARVSKAPSKEKQIAKLKYAKDDKVLKLVSINPAEIIGASELWVYNTKTRKLGKYVSAAYQQLGVKGTTITGFDSDKSVCKTLRKPEEKLKEFAKAGKVQLRKFLDEIKATETKMNGRISTDIVLLKVA